MKFKLSLQEVLLIGAAIFLIGCDKRHPLPLQPSLDPNPEPKEPSPPPVTPPGELPLAILAMGQSNMVGYGMGTDQFDEIPGVTVDSFHQGPYPSVGGPRKGPAYIAAGILSKKMNRPIHVIMGAVSGSPMSTWVPNGAYYGPTVDEAAGYKVIAVLFDQGETEATTNPGYQWAYFFEMMARDLQARFGAHLPIIYAQIGPNGLGPAEQADWNKIMDNQATVMVPYVSMVPTTGLEMADTEHYSKNGYYELGSRMANAFMRTGM